MSQVDVGKFFDNLTHTHIVYFHDGGEESKHTEFNFIKKGLEQQQHCFYTTQNPEEILSQMKDYGIDVEGKSDLLHIVKIPPDFVDYSKIILDKIDTLPQDSEIRLISTHRFDFDTEQKTDKMAEIEQCVDDDFDKIKGNMICSFAVNKINGDIRGRFLNQLLDSHTAIVFLSLIHISEPTRPY